MTNDFGIAEREQTEQLPNAGIEPTGYEKENHTHVSDNIWVEKSGAEDVLNAFGMKAVRGLAILYEQISHLMEERTDRCVARRFPRTERWCKVRKN